jgi:hypothetical protein
MALPDFFVLGAPKAGTTALHAALARHPELWLSPVKEPKYYLTAGENPARRGAPGQQGPGDRHSAREWVWRRADYERLFESAPLGRLRGESTPFYLYDLHAQQRIRRDVPEARLVAVLRDPVDRAYSNWMHLWSDGLEPIGDFLTAYRAEDDRVAAGWAPFWHYGRLGRYGEQLDHLYALFPREQVHVLRYRDLAEEPVATLDAVCRFLGVRTGVLDGARAENSKPYVAPSRRAHLLARGVRLGAAAGAWAPPQYWRAAERRLLRRLQRGGAKRPTLDPAIRRGLVSDFAADNALLSRLTGRDFSDWLGETSRGQFGNRTTVERSTQEPAR